MQYIPTVLKKPLRVDSIVSIHYFEYPTEFAFPGEAHDFWELIFCDRGVLELQGGSDRFLLTHGQAYLHPPGQFHNVRPAGGDSANSIILSFYSDTPQLYGLSGKILCTDSYTADALRSVLQEARVSFQNPLGKAYDAQLMRRDSGGIFGSEQVIQNYIELLFIHLIRQRDLGTQFPELPTGEGQHPVLVSAVRFMKENLHRKLTFTELTAHCSVSPTTMKHLFRKSFGCGTMEYLTSLRVARAKELLLGGTLSCTDIAERCGFCSVHHFSRVFKDSVRMSPTEYVKSVKAMLETEDGV